MTKFILEICSELYYLHFSPEICQVIKFILLPRNIPSDKIYQVALEVLSDKIYKVLMYSLVDKICKVVMKNAKL